MKRRLCQLLLWEMEYCWHKRKSHTIVFRPLILIACIYGIYFVIGKIIDCMEVINCIFVCVSLPSIAFLSNTELVSLFKFGATECLWESTFGHYASFIDITYYFSKGIIYSENWIFIKNHWEYIDSSEGKKDYQGERSRYKSLYWALSTNSIWEFKQG